MNNKVNKNKVTEAELRDLIEKLNERLSLINNRLDTIERRLLAVETKNNISSLIEITPRIANNNSKFFYSTEDKGV
jgi:hypothetical protein